MKMNDNTILRIKVPAHLYESVKAQLTLKEAQNFGMPGAKTVKVKDSSSGDKPKKTSAPKAKSAPKKANAPQKETGAGVSETKKADKGGHKKMGLEELQALAELLNNEITKLQEKSHDKKEKAPVEEAFDMTKTIEIADTINSALKAGQKVMVNGKEIDRIQGGKIKIKHLGPRDPITGGSGVPDIDLSDVTSLVIDGEEQTLPQSKEPEYQDVSQPAKPLRPITGPTPDWAGKLD